jgi:hypothetical protein
MSGKLPPPLPAAAGGKSSFWPIVIILVAAWLIAGRWLTGHSPIDDAPGAFDMAKYRSDR